MTDIVAHHSALPLPDGDDQAANVFPDETHLRALAATVDTYLTPTEKKNAREAITHELVEAETYRDREDYTQKRRYETVIVPGSHWNGDCSALPPQIFKRVRKLTGIDLADPHGRSYDGYGYTGTLLQHNHQHPVPLGRRFLVGDLAIYGPFWATRHVVMCRKAGTAATAVWTSHGSMAGPLPVRLLYRGDLLGVYRPESLL